MYTENKVLSTISGTEIVPLCIYGVYKIKNGTLLIQICINRVVGG